MRDGPNSFESELECRVQEVLNILLDAKVRFGELGYDFVALSKSACQSTFRNSIRVNVSSRADEIEYWHVDLRFCSSCVCFKIQQGSLDRVRDCLLVVGIV